MLFGWVTEYDKLETKGKSSSNCASGHSSSFVATVPNGMETAKNLELLTISDLDCFGKKVQTCYSWEIDKKFSRVRGGVAELSDGDVSFCTALHSGIYFLTLDRVEQ